MDITQACVAIIGIVAASFTAIWVCRYNRQGVVNDIRRKAATTFYARINECIEQNGLNLIERTCVCHDSYAAFRMTLDTGQSYELERCWENYTKHKRNDEKVLESLRCLKQCVHAMTRT